ncbi:hypothetical protein NBO_81g0027 [Nosema bombycis CQ1]|uniref:Uncharacterized protein n=1 Tax=Nosema bombycis (strain CQ1 / CVCC 102059) TaxID=578461 RepID=R0M5S2_NOSB1|nr:hypothetical protein NBO_81g0027 [Nosema bombycis CQ1]|eukprot:EOB13334.1 hypothetical protein NBO_81g0027 [Nosema bombycis CQ1]
MNMILIIGLTLSCYGFDEIDVDKVNNLPTLIGLPDYMEIDKTDKNSQDDKISDNEYNLWPVILMGIAASCMVLLFSAGCLINQHYKKGKKQEKQSSSQQ